VNGVDTDYAPADISIVTVQAPPDRLGVLADDLRRRLGLDRAAREGGWVTFIDFTEDLKRSFREHGLSWPLDPDEN
jgi:hypothetical protein